MLLMKTPKMMMKNNNPINKNTLMNYARTLNKTSSKNRKFMDFLFVKNKINNNQRGYI